MTRWELSRRELLAKLGVGLGCLPLLQATRSYAAAPAFPSRFVCVMQPFGYRPAQWLPPVGPLGALPSSAAALEPHKADLIFLGNLTNPAFKGCGRCGRGAYSTLFTGGATRAAAPADGEYVQPAGTSVDHVIALGRATFDQQMRVLALGVQVEAGSGTMPLGSRRCFWSRPGFPVWPQSDPYLVAKGLLGGGKRLTRTRNSILNYVGRELERFGRRVGTEDRAIVEQHFTSIRELERYLSMPATTGSACDGLALDQPPIDIDAPANFRALVDLQTRLLVLALRCGVAPVATLQLGDARGSGVPFGFAGNPSAASDWESLALAPPGPSGGADAKLAIDKWCMGALATLLAAMKAVPEGDGTMLDHAVVLWATPMEDGSTLDPQKLPWILAGRCNGFFKTGQAVASAGKPMNGVLAQIAAAMGVPVPHFGDPAFGQPMAELRA